MFSKRFNIIPLNVILIGCGGTGSRVVPLIAQYLSTFPEILAPTFTLIDGDDVEPKNLARQNFIQDDVGRYKAEVLAERYGEAYGVNVVAINKFYNMVPEVEVTKDVKPDFAWQRFLEKSLREIGVTEQIQQNIIHRPQVIISCVDNVVARMNILMDIMQSRSLSRNQWKANKLECSGIINHVIIDAGNENTYGQVRIYNPMPVAHIKSMSPAARIENLREQVGDLVPTTLGNTIDVPFLPVPIGAYARSLVNASVADRSCADLDQTMAVNVQMAIGIFQMFQNLAMNHPFRYHTWYYDIHHGNSQAPINVDYFKEAFSVTDNAEGNDYQPITSSMEPSSPYLAAYSKLSQGLQSLFLSIRGKGEPTEMCSGKYALDVLQDRISSAISNKQFSIIDPVIKAIIRGVPAPSPVPPSVTYSTVTVDEQGGVAPVQSRDYEPDPF